MGARAGALKGLRFAALPDYAGTMHPIESSPILQGLSAIADLADALGIVTLLLAHFVVPIGLAKLLQKASWREIAVAYGIWTGALAIFGAWFGFNVGMMVFMALLMAVFLTTGGILGLVLAQRALSALQTRR